VLGFRNVPNRVPGVITYWNDQGDEGLAIEKEDRYNIDYFHDILNFLKIKPGLFVSIAFSGGPDLKEKNYKNYGLGSAYDLLQISFFLLNLSKLLEGLIILRLIHFVLKING
jgi:hypothetical protein